MTERERSRFEISRLDRAGTLLLSSIALAVIVRLVWGGPIFDLHFLGDVAARVVAAAREGLPVGPLIVSLIRGSGPADIMPLVGTVISVVLLWHAISLAAEVVLAIADALGWLRTRWLMPVWRLLDILDTAPLAGPKRFVVAGALAGQIVVRSGLPVQAASLQAAQPVIIEAHSDSAAGVSPRLAQADDQPETPLAPWLIHHVRKGDTLIGLSRRYYGDDGHWVTLFRGNAGAVMGWADGGRGGPVRLTNPDYILDGCDLAVIPVPGVLEGGPNGEVIYVVQPGDTLSGIASRFDVSLGDLWATNEGGQGPDGRVLDDPNKIWPTVRIQVRPVGAALEPAPEAEPEPTEEVAPPVIQAVPVEPTPAPVPATSTAAQPPRASSEPTLAVPTPAVPAINGAPVVAPVLVPAERPPDSLPPFWPVAPVIIGGALLAGTLMARRRRRRPFETDLTYANGRVSAKPAQSLRTHVAGDPAELVAAALLQLTTSHDVDDVQLVTVLRDPREITVKLSVPARERDRLRLLLTAAAAPLARRVTVWETADHDVAVRLEDLRAAELAALDVELPLLVSIGGLGDGRELLGDWETLGHLLIVSRPGTDDACVQLAATVTMLAACQPVDRLPFYTCATDDSPLEPLGALPHQRVVARTPETMREVLAALERSLDAPGEADADRVLIIGELGDVGVEVRASLERVLALGPTHGLRVLSATTDLALASRLAAAYQTRVVYALGDEDASVRLLGSTDAANLPSDGSMLVRLGGRTELIEAYQLRVLDEDLAALLDAMRAADRSRPAEQHRRDQHDSNVEHERAGAIPPTTPEDESGPAGLDGIAEPGGVKGTPDSRADAESPTDAAGPLDADAAPGAELDQNDTAVSPADVPAHIGTLLARAEPGQPVLQCLGGLALWSRDRLGRVRLVGPGTGPRQLGLTRQVELLTYVAVRTATLAVGDDNRRGSVPEIEARSDLWGDAASKQIVGITARRLMLDLNKVGLEPPVSPLRAERGTVALDEDGCVVDAAAFEQAVRTARTARGAPGLEAAQAAVGAYGGRLLAGVGPEVDEDGGDQPVARVGRPTRAPLLGWTQELGALSVASKLEALYREALGLLAARLTDLGRVDESLACAWQALRTSEIVPPDDARRLARLVMDTAVAMPDQARARAEYQRLADYLDDSGLDLPEALQERLRPSASSSDSGRGKRVAVADD